MVIYIVLTYYEPGYSPIMGVYSTRADAEKEASSWDDAEIEEWHIANVD